MEGRITIKETLLSRKPKKNSGLIALACVGLITVSSQLYWGNVLGLAASMPAIPNNVFKDFEIWRLFTAIGTHSDLKHLLSNCASLLVLSYLTYAYFGGRVLFSLVLPVGALVNLASLATYEPYVRLVGASGVVFLLGGFWLTMYYFIDRRFTSSKRLLRCLGFGFIFFLPTTYRPEVSERTHAIGFLFGMIAAGFYFWKNRENLRNFESVEVEEPEPEPSGPLWN